MLVSVLLPCKADRALMMELIQDAVRSNQEPIDFDFEDIVAIARTLDHLVDEHNNGGASSRLSITIRLRFKKWSLEITLEF